MTNQEKIDQLIAEVTARIEADEAHAQLDVRHRDAEGDQAVRVRAVAVHEHGQRDQHAARGSGSLSASKSKPEGKKVVSKKLKQSGVRGKPVVKKNRVNRSSNLTPVLGVRPIGGSNIPLQQSSFR